MFLCKKFAVPINRGEVTQSWGNRKYYCGVIVDPPEREWKDIVHSTNELVTVVEGKLGIIIKGEELVLEPGDEVFIPNISCHSVKSIHNATT